MKPTKPLTMVPTGSPRDSQPTPSPGSIAPVAFLTTRPTWSPTISLWPTKAPNTKRPTWAPTISLWPTKAPNTNRPTFPPTPQGTEKPPLTDSPTFASPPSPTAASPTQQPAAATPTEEPTISRPSTFSPSASASSSPTLSSKPTKEDTTKSPNVAPTTNPPSPVASISPLPTTERLFPPKVKNLQMDLFGLEVLDGPGYVIFTRNTKQYIEWFYNEYQGPKEAIRGQVMDVTALIRVLDHVEGVGVERNRKKIYLGGRGKYLSSDDRSVWDAMNSPSEQWFGEFHSASHGERRQLDENGQDDRKLQDLGELCFGRFIGVRYTLEMAYRLSNPDITLTEVISEPFSTSEYRDIYLNEWLKADDPVGAFDSVKCTGPPKLFGVTPTAAPSVFSATPPSAVPSKNVSAGPVS